jgi:hypothetical protein
MALSCFDVIYCEVKNLEFDFKLLRSVALANPVFSQEPML